MFFTYICSICFFLHEHDSGVLEYNCDSCATSTVITSLPISGQSIVGRSRQVLIDYKSWHCECCWHKETNFCAKIPTSSSESFLQHAKSFLVYRSRLLSAGFEYIFQIIILSVSLFQQLTNRIKEMHNLTYCMHSDFLGKYCHLSHSVSDSLAACFHAVLICLQC